MATTAGDIGTGELASQAPGEIGAEAMEAGAQMSVAGGGTGWRQRTCARALEQACYCSLARAALFAFARSPLRRRICAKIFSPLSPFAPH